MKDLANIYIDNENNENNVDYLLNIYYFMLRNNIPKKDYEIVLRNADNVINLNNSISIKSEFETWPGVKNNHDNAPLEPLPKINWNYSNYHY